MRLFSLLACLVMPCILQLPGPLRPEDCHAECDCQSIPSRDYPLWSDCLNDDGSCPPNGADCWWQCRLKIQHQGQNISCPMDGVRMHVYIAASCDATPESVTAVHSFWRASCP